MASVTTGRRMRGVPPLLTKKIAPPVVATVIILVAWELYVRNANVDPTIFVAPSKIITHIPSVITSQLYRTALWATIKLLTEGFLLSAVLGVAVGLLLARFKILDRALTPFVNGAYAAPLPAIVPFITAGVGYELQAKLIAVVSLGIFPILINTYQGVAQTDSDLLEVGESFSCSEIQTWTNIVLPFAAPFILVGIRLGIVRCLIGTVIAEFYISQGGLGYMILLYSRQFDMASMFVPVLTLTALGLILVGIITLLERRLTPWQES